MKKDFGVILNSDHATGVSGSSVLKLFFCSKLERLLVTRHFSISQIFVGEG